MTEHQRQLIDELIDEFNFDRVLLAMTTLDWQWVSETDMNKLAVPTMSRLKTSARQLLIRAIDCECTGSGGLEARYVAPEGNAPEYFILKFVLTETCTWDD